MEFSTGLMIWILVVLAAMFLALPTLIGVVLMFRHRATTAHPTLGSSAKHFLLGLIVSALIQGAVIWIATAIQRP